MTASSRLSTSAGHWTPASNASRRTTSTSTSSTTSTGIPRGMRSGRPSRWPSSRARSCTRAAATSPAGTSPRHRPPPRGGRLGGVLRKETAVQRRPREDAQAVLLRRGNDFQLNGAGEQVVDGLFADQAGVVAPGGGGLCRGDVPAGEVAAARVQDLALLDGHLDGLPDLIPRGIPVDVVELVDVDVVRLEAFEAGVQCSTDVQSRELALIGPLCHAAV